MKIKNVIIIVVSVATILYGGLIIKRSFFDKGYPSEEVEKEILLGLYVLEKGLPKTKENKNKYRYMTLEQLRNELDINYEIVE